MPNGGGCGRRGAPLVPGVVEALDNAPGKSDLRRSGALQRNRDGGRCRRTRRLHRHPQAHSQHHQPGVAEDHGVELARTTQSPSPSRWSMPKDRSVVLAGPSCRGGWRHGAHQDDVHHQHHQAAATEDGHVELTRRHHRCLPHQDGACDPEPRRQRSLSTSSSWCHGG